MMGNPTGKMQSQGPHECSEYEPIQTIKNLSLEDEGEEPEDAGCDSCAHLNHGECMIYKREKY